MVKLSSRSQVDEKVHASRFDGRPLAKSDEEEDFTSHCVYIFQLIKSGDWKISGITQKVLWNEGSSSLH